MNEVSPSFRQETINSWKPLFADSKQSFSSLAVSVHGVALLFHTDNQKLISELKDFFPKKWQDPVDQPIQVTWIDPQEMPLKGVAWDDISDPDCQFAGDFISQRDFLAKKVTPKSYQLIAPHKIDDGLFNFLRYLLPMSLLEKNKILFHSSCVVSSKGEAYLFFGPSGAGKTTISSLCQHEGNVLGDDMNILSERKGSIYVEGAAVGQRLYNKENFGHAFPVKHAFWLVQSDKISHQRMLSGELKFYLSSFANLFWDQLDELAYEKVFQLTGNLKEKLPLHQLNFTKDNEVWNYVQSIK